MTFAVGAIGLPIFGGCPFIIVSTEFLMSHRRDGRLWQLRFMATPRTCDGSILYEPFGKGANGGILLDMERGYWGKGPEGDAPDGEDGMSPLVARVIPFVEERRNCLIFQPEAILEDHQMASLQSALKNAVQVRFQLEENELAAEPLPSFMDRWMTLFYESAERRPGGVARRKTEGRSFVGPDEAVRF